MLLELCAPGVQVLKRCCFACAKAPRPSITMKLVHDSLWEVGQPRFQLYGLPWPSGPYGRDADRFANLLQKGDAIRPGHLGAFAQRLFDVRWIAQQGLVTLARFLQKLI